MKKRIIAFTIIFILIFGSIGQNTAFASAGDAAEMTVPVLYESDNGKNSVKGLDGLSIGDFIELSEEELLAGEAEHKNAEEALEGSLKMAPPVSLDADGTWNPHAGGYTYGYSKLDSAGKALYNAIDALVKQFRNGSSYTSDLTVQGSGYCVMPVSGDAMAERPGGLSDEDAYGLCWTVYLSYYYDHPQYYWLYGGCAYGASLDYLHVYLYIDGYYATAASRAAADNAIEEISSAWCTQLNAIKSAANPADDSEGSKYRTVIKLQELITERIDYTYDSKGNPEGSKWAHSIAGIFTGQGGVCEAYARVFQYMLNLLSIDNLFIAGYGGTPGNGGGHAWSAVKFGSKWYDVDVTWDDCNNGPDDSTHAIVEYDYFCIPAASFALEHKPGQGAWCYELPTRENSSERTFWHYFKSYADGTLNDSQVTTLIATAKSAKYGKYIHFVSPTVDNLYKIASKLNLTSAKLRSSTEGTKLVYRCSDTQTPATAVAFSATGAAIEVGETINVMATLSPSNSDDEILYSISDERVVSLSCVGDAAIIKGKANGTSVLTATAVSSGKTATYTVVVGSGVYTSEATIWQNGGKDYKSCTVSTDLQASDWTDARGKTKKGKLVWIIKDEKTTPEFDETKHTLKTKSDKVLASINNKGKVTAKKAGTAYAYACDTGSLTFEEHEITILAAPTKLQLGRIPESAAKSNILTKKTIKVGETARVYLLPYVKDGTASAECTYTVEADAKNAAYVTLSEVKEDALGYFYFDINATGFDESAGRPGSVKVTVVNKESGKKVNMTVVTSNPVGAVGATIAGDNSVLAQKGDTVELTVNTATYAGGSSKTTDKAKVYVGYIWMYMFGNKVTYDTGATVKAALSSDGTKVTLTAGKNAGVKALVYIAYTDSTTKETELYFLARVDEEGNVFTTK